MSPYRTSATMPEDDPPPKRSYWSHLVYIGCLFLSIFSRCFHDAPKPTGCVEAAITVNPGQLVTCGTGASVQVSGQAPGPITVQCVCLQNP